jgi:hypothetical protein
MADRATELAKWLHHKMCVAQNLPWEEGETCEDCDDSAKEFLAADALAGARLAAEPPRITADALEAVAAQIRDTPSYKQGVNDEHKSHVEFEMELYATLVDPLLDEPIKEAELRKQLLESARWYRQHVEDLENQLNKLRAGTP